MGRDGGDAAGRVVGRGADSVGLGSGLAGLAGDDCDGGVDRGGGGEGGGGVGEGEEGEI